MTRTSLICAAALTAIAWGATAPVSAQIFPGFAKPKGLPKIAVAQADLPPLANPAYGEVLLSGNEALLEPAWLIGSLRDAATGQILKWNNYLRPDAKPNVKLVTEPVFEGFVDGSSVAKAEWLSTLKSQITDRAVAEVVVTRVSVTSVEPKQIDRERLLSEIVERLPADQQGRYSVVIAYIDVAITATRFQHYEVDGDVAGYGGRIGGEWYYKDKQKTTDHRLVAISAPLQFAVTAFAPQVSMKSADTMKSVETMKSADVMKSADDLFVATGPRSCHELVGDAIRRGVLPMEKPSLGSVLCCTANTWPIGKPQPADVAPRQIAEQVAAAEARQAAARQMEAARQAAIAAEQMSASKAAARMPSRSFAEREPAAAASAGRHYGSADLPARTEKSSKSEP